MYPVSDLFLSALRSSHSAVVRLDAYRGGVLLASDLPISAGSVTVDASSKVRRQLTATIADPSLAPAAGDPDAMLAPYGTELRAYRGIRHLTGAVEWVPLGRFRVESARADVQASGVEVTAADRSALVAGARFLAPTPSVTTNTVPAEIARLIRGAAPDAAVTDETGYTGGVAALTWERERWDAVESLATGIGAEVFFDPDGVARIRPVPSIDSPLAWTVDAGEGGVMVAAEQRTSRERTFNGVVVTGERTDGTPPVAATVTDDDPASPTYWYGGFGQVPHFYSSPQITTTGQATTTAVALLGRTRGLVRQLTLASIPNPALDALDVIGVVFPDGSTERHLVDKLTVPLDPGEAMPIETRSPEPVTEGES